MGLLVKICGLTDRTALDAALEAGAEADARNDWNLGALHLAAERGSTEIVRRLLDAGADGVQHHHQPPRRHRRHNSSKTGGGQDNIYS